MKRIRYKVYQEPINYNNPFKVVDTYTGVAIFRGDKKACEDYLNTNFLNQL